MNTVGLFGLGYLFIYLKYLHLAAEKALKSDDPIVFNHLEAVISGPDKYKKGIIEDIEKELKIYISGILNEGSALDGNETLPVYPVIVAEKGARRVQMRILIATEDQIDINALPKENELLVKDNKGGFTPAESVFDLQHLRTRRHIANALQSNPTLYARTKTDILRSAPAMALST